MQSEKPPGGIQISDLLGLGNGLGRSKLGPGVVGITGTVVAIGVIGLVLVAQKMSGTGDLLIIAGMIVFVLIAFLIGAIAFAYRHPGAALLGSADFVRYSQIQAGTKEDGLINVTPVLNPSLESVNESDGDA